VNQFTFRAELHTALLQPLNVQVLTPFSHGNPTGSAFSNNSLQLSTSAAADGKRSRLQSAPAAGPQTRQSLGRRCRRKAETMEGTKPEILSFGTPTRILGW